MVFVVCIDVGIRVSRDRDRDHMLVYCICRWYPKTIFCEFEYRPFGGVLNTT